MLGVRMGISVVVAAVVVVVMAVVARSWLVCRWRSSREMEVLAVLSSGAWRSWVDGGVADG
jgi:hypothetical protein